MNSFKKGWRNFLIYCNIYLLIFTRLTRPLGFLLRETNHDWMRKERVRKDIKIDLFMSLNCLDDHSVKGVTKEEKKKRSPPATIVSQTMNREVRLPIGCACVHSNSSLPMSCGIYDSISLQWGIHSWMNDTEKTKRKYGRFSPVSHFFVCKW